MCYENLANILNKSEEFDPVTPKLIKGVMKNDSRAIESVAKKWNMPWLEQEAHGNVQDPAKGVAKASVATGLGFLGAGIGNWLGGSGGVAMGASNAPGPGVVAPGMQGKAIMDTALINSGMQGMAGYGSGGMMGNMAQRMAMNQAMGMMNQQPPQPPPPPPPPPPQEPLMNPYMTEEEKRRLLMQMQRGY